MIDYDEAIEIVLERAPGPFGTEHCPLLEARGRVLARDIFSDVDLPPFDKSGMDGFAVRSSDLTHLPVTLDVVMDVPAGGIPTGSVEPGQAAAVMTGAVVPGGADGVVQVEWTSGFGSPTVTIEKPVAAGQNVSPLGEIFRTGDRILSTGAFIDIEETGLLAATGCDPVPVFRRPGVAILSTGDEVVPPGQKPGPSQIRDVNGPALAAFVRSLGLEPVNMGSVKDDPDTLKAAVEKGLEHDCLLMSGGVSAGAYDFVEDVLEALGVEVHTRRIAVKPGKPTVFGTRGDSMIFGLPGNPVSAMVIARLLVAPALRKRMGLPPLPPRMVKATLMEDIRKKADRAWFIHGRLDKGAEPKVTPLVTRGSADLPAAAAGNCLIFAARGLTGIPAGTEVDVVVWERSL